MMPPLIFLSAYPQVFSHNLVKDDFIGSYTFDLVSLNQNKSSDFNASLEDPASGEVSEKCVDSNLVYDF